MLMDLGGQVPCSLLCKHTAVVGTLSRCHEMVKIVVQSNNHICEVDQPECNFCQVLSSLLRYLTLFVNFIFRHSHYH